MPTIKVTLGSASISNAIAQLEDYQRKVENLGEKVTKRLTEDGVKQAQDYAMYMNAYDSGELVDSIVPEYRDNKGYIHSTAPHSAFVEMGTGIMGQNAPNSNNTVPGWVYDVNEHGEKGWYYIGRDGRKHWTKGMPSRPFMYDTAQTIRQSVQYVVEDELQK